MKRSSDASLKGMIYGFHLQTKPEEIYRALLESTAFGLKKIVEQYESSGITVRSICAAGGIAQKDSLMMQIYADVLGREIQIAGTSQAAARGSAIYAAYASGAFPTPEAAAKKLSKSPLTSYLPKAENVRAYQRLYEKYTVLHDLFGREYKSILQA